MSRTPLEGQPRVREPLFFIPPVVLVFVFGLIAIHGLVQMLSESQRDFVYFDWGFVPGRFTAVVAPSWIADLVARAGNDDNALNAARMLRDSGALGDGSGLVTLSSYALLHGSWAHVGVNSIWLVAFGPPVARRFGALRFTLFFFFTAAAGALAHWLSAPFAAFPLIGASAADSGLMAAAARFMFRPGAAISVGPDAALGRASTLRELLVDRRALIFIAIWMIANFVFGAGATALGGAEAPIAWIAHVGGFAAGLLGFGLFDRAPKIADSDF